MSTLPLPEEALAFAYGSLGPASARAVAAWPHRLLIASKVAAGIRPERAVLSLVRRLARDDGAIAAELLDAALDRLHGPAWTDAAARRVALATGA